MSNNPNQAATIAILSTLEKLAVDLQQAAAALKRIREILLQLHHS